MQNIVIIGATSAIAEATAKLFAQQQARLYLIARNTTRLNSLVDDLRIRGAAEVFSQQLDVNDTQAHQLLLANIQQAMSHIDVLLIAHGTLPNQLLCEKDTQQMLHELNTNAISSIALLNQFANVFEQQQLGQIAVITSVAGDRGRQSNYVYGSAKAMVSTFLQGLRNRLQKHNVNVIDIKPGFVDTPMTADFDKGALWAQPEDIANRIIWALKKKKSTVYTPFFWRYIMLIIKSIPEFIFKKLSL